MEELIERLAHVEALLEQLPYLIARGLAKHERRIYSPEQEPHISYVNEHGERITISGPPIVTTLPRAADDPTPRP